MTSLLIRIFVVGDRAVLLHSSVTETLFTFESSQLSIGGTGLNVVNISVVGGFGNVGGGGGGGKSSIAVGCRHCWCRALTGDDATFEWSAPPVHVHFRGWSEPAKTLLGVALQQPPHIWECCCCCWSQGSVSSVSTIGRFTHAIISSSNVCRACSRHRGAVRGEKFTCTIRLCVGELQLPGPVPDIIPETMTPSAGSTTACGPSLVGRVFDLTGEAFWDVGHVVVMMTSVASEPGCITVQVVGAKAYVDDDVISCRCLLPKVDRDLTLEFERCLWRQKVGQWRHFLKIVNYSSVQQFFF